MQHCMFVSAGFLRDRFLIRYIKLFNKSTLKISDSVSFVVWVMLKFWYRQTQVSLFVYIEDYNTFFSM